jgi:AhpD family alkylhydroperoxidase
MFLLDNVDALFNQFCGAVYEPDHLDQKTVELLSVACSVMADCVPCIEHHYKQAVAAGATREEISETLAVAMAIIAGSKRAKYRSVIGNLEQTA